MKCVRPVITKGDIAIVTLTKGYEAIVNVSDLAVICGFNWSALTSPRRSAVYACRVSNGQMVLMHRAILGASRGDEIDHKDGDGLNNRRENLRQCTRSQNNCNIGLRTDNKSGFKGVFKEARSNKWRAEVQIGGRIRRLGLFNSAVDAHAARCIAVSEMHGEFGRVS